MNIHVLYLLSEQSEVVSVENSSVPRGTSCDVCIYTASHFIMDCNSYVSW